MTSQVITCPANPEITLTLSAEGFDIEGINGHGPLSLGVVEGPGNTRAPHYCAVREGRLYGACFINYSEFELTGEVMDWLKGEANSIVQQFKLETVEAELKRLLTELDAVQVDDKGQIMADFRDFPAGTCREQIRHWLISEAQHHGAAQAKC